MLHETIERDGSGAVVDRTGDGVLAVFAEPSAAVERGLRIQSRLRGHPHIRVRVGIDMGQVAQESRGGAILRVFGRHVNRAARIQRIARPGHVLLSAHVFDSAVGWLRTPDVAWHRHGEARLKGFTDPVSIVEVYDPRSCSPQLGPFDRAVSGPDAVLPAPSEQMNNVGRLHA
jgi:class 3 adenylate cyclase